MAKRTAAHREQHSDDMPIEQKPTITLVKKGQAAGRLDPVERDSEIVSGGENILGNKEYTDLLAFMEEPVTIRLEPSTEKNAPTVFPIWINGIGAEVFISKEEARSIHPEEGSGQWIAITYLPVGIDLTVKRKVLEVIIRAKIDTIHTQIIEKPNENPENKVNRFTSAVYAFSILYDPNPRGPAWVREVRRRNG